MTHAGVKGRSPVPIRKHLPFHQPALGSPAVRERGAAIAAYTDRRQRTPQSVPGDRRSHHPADRNTLGPSGLWRLPAGAFMWILGVEVLAAVICGVEVVIGPPPDAAAWTRCAVLMLAVMVALVPALRPKQWHHDRSQGPHIDLTSVWTLAGVIVLPPLLMIMLTLFVGAVTAAISRRPVHQYLYSTAAILASGVGAHLLLATLNVPFIPATGGLRTALVLFAAALFYGIVEALLVVHAIRLTTKPRPRLLSVLGSATDNMLELAALLLGLIVTTLPPWWVPLLAAVVALTNYYLDRQQRRHAAYRRQLTELLDQVRRQREDHAQREEHLAAVAALDATGVLNKTAWRAAAERLAVRWREQGGRLTVVMLDLDYFKTINDQYSHPAGDAVLDEIGAILREESRDSDTCVAGRVGGEEFALALLGVGLEDGEVIADRLRARIGTCRVWTTGHDGARVALAGRGNYQPVVTATREIRLVNPDLTRDQTSLSSYDPDIGAHRVVSASLGVAASVNPGEALDQVLAAADAALRQAKRARNTVVAWVPPSPMQQATSLLSGAGSTPLVPVRPSIVVSQTIGTS